MTEITKKYRKDQEEQRKKEKRKEERKEAVNMKKQNVLN